MKNFISDISRMRILKVIGAVMLLLIIIYLAGPTPEKFVPDTNLPPITADVAALEKQIAEKENAFKSLRPDNQARIVWADSSRTKTEWSIVYLHGFSASWKEGDPVVLDMAKRYGCNLFLSRLYAHGLDTAENMVNLTADKFLQSAKEAIAIGKTIGEKVLVVTCSTGGTLGLYLASEVKNMDALVLYSPNLKIYDPTAAMLDRPWGLHIARAVTGSDYHSWKATEEKKKYFTTHYRMEALVALQSLISHTMKKETFEKITCPVFLGYYYKNEEEQDKVVSVKAMQEMFTQLGTVKEKKREISFPEAGDHVICSAFNSKDITGVELETFKFCEEVIGLKPIQ
ncbi:MAG: alpha/beta hydrolase [Bacteroidia bacterium]